MRWVCLIAVLLAVPAGFMGGQESGSAKAAAAAASAPAAPSSVPAQAAPGPAQMQAAPASASVKVYAPSSAVKEPQLLPLTPPPSLAKDCKQHADGEVLLSLLVDTAGRARNVMFLKPAGSAVDRIAIHIAGQDRFEPGTLDGKPVVVAEALRIKLKGCDSTQTNPAGGVLLNWMLTSLPNQKLEKPKDPPEEAMLAPAEDENGGVEPVVKRADFFGAEVSAPVILYSQDAEYLPAKAGTQITGTCELGLVVDRHGLPEDIHVIKSVDPGLDLSAMLAVNMYRFFPAIRNGEEPVPAAIVVSVQFAPPGTAARE
ncbi:MAG TPA: energy transducer TonB [Terracidiphilus sp.]|nr:energy transducer TonB [Terracidiphilus sp.]